MGCLRPSRVRIPPPPLNALAVGDPRAGSRPAEPDEPGENPAARRVPAADPADQRAGRGLRQGGAGAGRGRRIGSETADASATTFERAAYDVALCLGASFVWGTIADAAAVLA